MTMGFRSHLSGLDDVDAVVRVAHPEEVLPGGHGHSLDRLAQLNGMQFDRMSVL